MLKYIHFVSFHFIFNVLSSFFDVKKQIPKVDIEQYYQCTVSIGISLNLKVCFSQVT